MPSKQDFVKCKSKKKQSLVRMVMVRILYLSAHRPKAEWKFSESKRQTLDHKLLLVAGACIVWFLIPLKPFRDIILSYQKVIQGSFLFKYF